MVAVARPKFELGKIVATLGSKVAMERAGQSPCSLFNRHSSVDWGDLGAEDRQANADAVISGERIFSSYLFHDGKAKIWIITEADRSSTTLLLPDEF